MYSIYVLFPLQFCSQPVSWESISEKCSNVGRLGGGGVNWEGHLLKPFWQTKIVLKMSGSRTVHGHQGDGSLLRVVEPAHHGPWSSAPLCFSPFSFDQSLSASHDFFTFFFLAGVPSQQSVLFTEESFHFTSLHRPTGVSINQFSLHPWEPTVVFAEERKQKNNNACQKRVLMSPPPPKKTKKMSAKCLMK